MDTTKILSIVKSLSRTRRQCVYHQVDLHVHSPASSDYDGDKNVSPYDFVYAFVERGFDLIAITDHHTGLFIDQAINAREQIAADEAKNITVLPGVELNVSPGVHLLAILPEGGSAAISDLLSRLGLPARDHGDTTKLISRPIAEVAYVVHERAGLLIGAHCNSTSGIVEELDGQARLEWLRTVDALEIGTQSSADHIAKTMDYVSNSLHVNVPFTFGSDSHNCELDRRGMWVKMADTSLTSLRQLTFEPELRISQSDPVAPAHGRIVGITTTHGIYGHARFRFSPHLNVLIGGRGAGKSAVIDLLRFAFDAGPQVDDANVKVFNDRIKAFLLSIGEVVIVAVGTDGHIYVVTRAGSYEERRGGAIIFDGRPKVHRVVGTDLLEIDMDPLDILGVEFYGQGEAIRLANRVEDQMRLIDENLDLSAQSDAIRNADAQLAETEASLVDFQHALEELRIEAASRSRLEERQAELSRSLEDPIFGLRSRWDRDQDWLQGHQNWIDDVLQDIPESVAARPESAIDVETSPAVTILKRVQEISDSIFESGKNDLANLRSRLAEAKQELIGHRTEWEAAFEVAHKRYLERLAELGAEDREQIAVQLRAVEQSLERINTVVAPEIARITSEIQTLEQRRNALLEQLTDARKSIDDSRELFVEKLNADLGGDVVVDLSGRDTSAYFAAVESPLQGSGMQRREDQVQLLCDSFSPKEFVDILRTGSLDKLTAVGITHHSATLIKNAFTEKLLYQIERIDVPPLPSIRIKREGESTHTDLSSLSVGEKCSAILSIALLSKGKPLVIDQPEDDLDHAFITESIVQSLRSAKSERQIVAATHNPNIPVLGDAEMVFRVARLAGDGVCQIKNSGGLELPTVTEEVQSLEGGADAFERRRRRYSGIA